MMNAAQKKAQSDRMKLRWEQRKAKNLSVDAPAVGVTPRDRISEATPKPAITVVERTTGDKWADMPIDEALQELSKIEREVRHARETVSHRTSQLPVVLTCWTALHRKDHIPGIDTAYKQCHKDIPDGRWLYRDDCPRDPETGLVSPVVVCSMICFNVYQAQRAREKMKERTA